MIDDVTKLQPYLPQEYSLASYQTSGGMQDSYAPWLQGKMQDFQNKSNYVTFDSSYNFGSHPYGASGVNHSDPFAVAEDQYNKNEAAKGLGLGQTNNVNGNAPGTGNTATPGALNSLTKTRPDLQNRQPSLAAGWGGWDQNSVNGPEGSANFTYFSRFA